MLCRLLFCLLVVFRLFFSFMVLSACLWMFICIFCLSIGILTVSFVWQHLPQFKFVSIRDLFHFWLGQNFSSECEWICTLLNKNYVVALVEYFRDGDMSSITKSKNIYFGENVLLYNVAISSCGFSEIYPG